MKKDTYKVLGVMSGTSLDGVDLAYTVFVKNSKWNWEIITCETISYPKEWLDRLARLASMKIRDIKNLDEAYTEYLGKLILDFIEKHHITELDFISSHGHTALHQPQNSLTYQIGNLPLLAELTDIKVICDFRKQDVELGGQGAPLVPIGDQVLFGNYDYCLNLGGFANISTQLHNSRIAYDICPVNVVLNHYARIYNMEYDENGKIAKSGNLDVSLLNKLNDLEYYKLDFPKSLGYEWVDKFVFPLLNKDTIPPNDVLRTLVEHISYQIGNSLKGKKSAQVLVTGGGAYNEFLIDNIKKYTNAEIVLPSTKVIDYKEAIIFALLGVLRSREEINCLNSVTGAERDHSSGIIHQPKNYSY